MPLTIGLLYTIHRYLQKLKDRKQADIKKLLDSDYVKDGR